MPEIIPQQGTTTAGILILPLEQKGTDMATQKCLPATTAPKEVGIGRGVVPLGLLVLGSVEIGTKVKINRQDGRTSRRPICQHIQHCHEVWMILIDFNHTNIVRNNSEKARNGMRLLNFMGMEIIEILGLN